MNWHARRAFRGNRGHDGLCSAFGLLSLGRTFAVPARHIIAASAIRYGRTVGEVAAIPYAERLADAVEKGLGCIGLDRRSRRRARPCIGAIPARPCRAFRLSQLLQSRRRRQYLCLPLRQHRLRRISQHPRSHHPQLPRAWQLRHLQRNGPLPSRRRGPSRRRAPGKKSPRRSRSSRIEHVA